MTALNKQALREAAEKATPGRWEYYPGNTSIEYNVDSMVEDQGSIVYVDSGDFIQDQTARNGEFIAAANPATVLALLDDLEAAEKRIAELEAREVAVKQFDDFQIVHYGGSEDYAKGYIDCQNNYNKALSAAGIGVKGGVRCQSHQ